MNSLLATPPIPPHFHEPSHSRFSPTRSMSSITPSQSRKRKASPDDQDDRMSSSPTTSPAISSSSLPSGPRSVKKPRPNLSGRSLSLPRLLETLDTDSLRTVLSSLCSHHPGLDREVTALAPRPSVPSTLQVLHEYQQKLRDSFPLGGNTGSDYAYNRVRSSLMNLLEALNDFTPQFLPPAEPQTAVSLSYLDGVTQIIHDLPQWDRVSNNLAKVNAYEEIARAWAVVLREAGKRGAGMGIVSGQWDSKVAKHHEISGGKMGEAVEELRKCVGWMAGQTGGGSGSGSGMGSGGGPSAMSERELVRQQLMSGTYGAPGGIRTGFW